MFYLMKWDLIRQFKENTHVYFYRLNKRIWGMTQIARMIKAILIWKSISKMWKEHLEIHTRKQRGIYISLIMK